jgi:hypothetical protein
MISIISIIIVFFSLAVIVWIAVFSGYFNRFELFVLLAWNIGEFPMVVVLALVFIDCSWHTKIASAKKSSSSESYIIFWRWMKKFLFN